MSAVALAVARHAAGRSAGPAVPIVRVPHCRSIQACRSAHLHGGHLSRHRVLVVGFATWTETCLPV